jgi:hypothetical protein
VDAFISQPCLLFIIELITNATKDDEQCGVACSKIGHNCRAKTASRPSLSASIVKIEVELLGDGGIVLLDSDTDLADITLCAVVKLAIIEDELHVIHEVLDSLILVLPQLCFDG